MTTATPLTTKNNAWLTVGKATWVAFWFLLALAVKASIILLTVVGKILGAILLAIFTTTDEDEKQFDRSSKTRETGERQAVGADDYEAYK